MSSRKNGEPLENVWSRTFPAVESTINSAKLKSNLFKIDTVKIELIYVVGGESIHSRFLEERSEGLNRLGFFVKDMEKELVQLKKDVVKVLERGSSWNSQICLSKYREN